MALNNFKCNRLMPLHFKGLKLLCIKPILLPSLNFSGTEAENRLYDC